MTMKQTITKYLPLDNVFSLISIFFLVFGVTLLVAVAYTDTTKGIVVNLICALFFFISSILSALHSKKSSQTKKTNK